MEIVWTDEIQPGECVVTHSNNSYDYRMLKLTFDECREKLKVVSDKDVYRYITLDGIHHPATLTRLKLERDPRNLIRILREQILSASKPKLYPACNSRKNNKPKRLSGEIIKKRVLKKLASGDFDGLKKMCQAKKSSLDRVKKDLRRAILDEDYCLDLMKKYLSLLPPPADF